MQGTPETMQKNPKYDDALLDVYDFFEEKIKDIDVSVFEDMSDISDIEIDSSDDEVMKSKKLPTARELFGSGDSSDDE